MIEQRYLPQIMNRTATEAVRLDCTGYEALISDPAQCVLSQRILDETDPERQQQLKATLPAVIWMARYADDGHRPKKDQAVASGLCFHDLDHLDEDPRQVFEQQIKPRLEELAIGLVKLSARGNGLHLVSLVPEGWTPQQTQIWVAEKCGLSQYRDAAVTDLSRLSYVSSKPMHLYYNRELLWQADVDHPFVCLESPPAIDPIAKASATATPTAPAEGELFGTTIDTSQIPTMYDDQVQYDALVARIIDHYGGVPRSFGGRHEAFKRFAFALASVMDYSAAVVMHYLEPYRQQVDTVPGQPFGVTELRELVLYACQKKTYSQSREVRQALVECRATMPKVVEPAAADAQTDEEVESENFLQEFTHRELKMPKVLPGMLNTLVSIAPEHYRPVMALSAMCPLMTLADGVTFDDLMGNERTLQNHTIVVGPPSSNKGMIVRQTEMLLKRLMERDQQELAKVQANNKELRAAERSSRAKEVKEYDPMVRVLPPATSVNEFLELQTTAGDQTLMIYTPEISNITQACGSGSWGDLRTCFREGWDRDYHGQLRSTSKSYSGRVRLRLNVIAMGTPGQAFGYRQPSGRWKSGFYEDKENGLASRLMILFMPYVVGENMFRFKKFTVEQKDSIERMTLQLEAEQGFLYAARLHKTMERWQKEMANITLRVGGGIIDEGRRRAAVQGLACGYLAYLMEGRKDTNVVSNWARYCADICLQNYLLAYASQENNGAALMPNASCHGAPIQDLLALLPNPFTVQQVRDIRRGQGKSENVKSLLSRLMAEGIIESIGEKSGIYRKL